MKKTPMKQPVQESSNGTLNIRPVARIDRPRNWVIYGRSKTGKTTFAGSFPKPALLVDIRDRGTDSVMDIKDLDVVEAENLDTLEEVYYFLKSGTHKYKTVILDTVTQLQGMVLEDIAEGNKRGGEDKRIGDWGSMTQKSWGNVSAAMKDWITRFKDLPMEVVFLAQDRTKNVDDEDTSDNVLMPEVGPAVMPSVALVMNAAVDIIGNTFIRLNSKTIDVKGKKKKIENVVYCLRIGPNPIYTTGIRKPRGVEPPSYIEDPKFDDVMEIIRGE